MKKELKDMSIKKLKKELDSIQYHIDNFGFGRWELSYREEILKELDKRGFLEK